MEGLQELPEGSDDSMADLAEMLEALEGDEPVSREAFLAGLRDEAELEARGVMDRLGALAIAMPDSNDPYSSIESSVS